MNKTSLFEDTIEYPYETIERVQKSLLALAIEVVEIFNKNKIGYFIGFGTLLGAIRHKGFIPWDDDLDLFVFDEDYQRAIDIVRDSLSSHYILHDIKSDHKYFHSWARVKDTRTKVEYKDYFHEDNKRLSYKSIGIDLYNLKKIPAGNIKNYLKEEAVKFWDRKLQSGLVTPSEHSVGILSVEDFVMGRMSTFDPSLYQGYVYYFILLLKEPISIEEIFPLKELEFEGRVFMGPANPDAILQKIYGDYMKLPPFNSRKPSLHSVTFSEF